MVRRNETKTVYLEFLRILSIILVIFIHTGQRGIDLYIVRSDSVFYPLYLFFSIAPRKIAVPLFWMISGAVLINKEESIGTLYKKRILKMALTLLLFSFAQYCYSLYKSQVRVFSPLDFLKKLYSNQYATAYWYIYSYLSLLMLLPIIRKMAKGMTRDEYKYCFMIFSIVFGIVPILECLVGGGGVTLNSRFTENMFFYSIIYYIGGYYIEYLTRPGEIKRLKISLLITAAITALILTSFIVQHMINVTGEINSVWVNKLVVKFYMVSCFIPTFCVFCVAKIFFERHEKWINEKNIEKLIITLGGTSFGVMLVENILRERLLFIYEFFLPHCRSFPSCIIWVLCVWICGVVITLILKRIPIIRKLI